MPDEQWITLLHDLLHAIHLGPVFEGFGEMLKTILQESGGKEDDDPGGLDALTAVPGRERGRPSSRLPIDGALRFWHRSRI
jgi:hypothetical protein